MATDYISRKKAIEEVCGDCEYYDSNDCEECRFDRLMKIPAADVVEVVRCKDCRYFTGKSCMINEGMRESPIDGNGFCSYGERRTE